MTGQHKTPWVDGLTIGEVLAATAGRHADREALVFPQLGRRWTWRQFAAEVDVAARGLIALGIGRGEHVALWATNVPEWVLLQFATARIGAVLVNINPAYRPFELEYVLNQSDAVALFLVDEFKSSNYFEMLAEVCPAAAQAQDGLASSPKFPKLRTIVAIKGSSPPELLTWQAMCDQGNSIPQAEVEKIAATLAPADPINIQYTSGTTGFPKAAMLTHRNLLLNAYHVGQCQRFTAEDRLCIPVPFYHCFGCVLGTMACVVHGSAMIVPAEYFQARPTLDALEHERATAVYGVPTMYIAQLQEESLAGRKFALRTGIMSGAPCPIEVMRQVIDKLGPSEITIAYGQTEASPVITQTRTDDPLELRVETVGRPLPDVEVKIVDPASGQELPNGEQGELCARGHVVMLGYYKN
ncbi:MAG: AMP-binding protein, partial [Pirellulaceae bacterium]